MSRPKFATEIPFHKRGDKFELIGNGGTEKRIYEVLRTEGAVADITEIKNGKRRNGRPMRVLMVEDYVAPEFLGAEIPG